MKKMTSFVHTGYNQQQQQQIMRSLAHTDSIRQCFQSVFVCLSDI